MNKKSKIILVAITIVIIILGFILVYNFNEKLKYPNEESNSVIQSKIESESIKIDSYFPINANIVNDYYGSSSKPIENTNNLENLELILFDNKEFVIIYDGTTSKMIRAGYYTENSEKYSLHILYDGADCSVKKVAEEEMDLYKNLDETIFIQGKFTDEIIKAIKADDIASISKDKYACINEIS